MKRAGKPRFQHERDELLRSYDTRLIDAELRLWGVRFLVIVLSPWLLSPLIGFRSSLAIVVFAGFVGAAIGLYRPVIGLLSVGLLSTIDPVMKVYLFTGGLLRWSTFDYWLLLIAVVFAPMIAGFSDLRIRSVQVVSVLLVLGLVITPDLHRGVTDTLSVLAVFGILVYFLRVSDSERVWFWLGLVCGSVGAAAATALFLDLRNLRPINGNVLAFMPLTGLFALCVGFHAARCVRSGQLIFALLAAFNIVCVLLTGSRGSLIVGVVGMLYLVVAIGGGHNRWQLVLIVATVAVMASATRLGDLEDRSIQRIVLLADSRSSLTRRTSGRVELIRNGWTLFTQQPWGIGTGGFALARGELTMGDRYGGWRSGEAVIAHAGWIKLLAENGIPGVLSMGTLVASFGLSGIRARRRDLLMIGLFGTAALAFTFLFTEYSNKGIWFLTAALTVLFHRRSLSSIT